MSLWNPIVNEQNLLLFQRQLSLIKRKPIAVYARMRKTPATILVIDDDEDVLLSAKLLLKRSFERVVTHSHPRDLNQLLSSEKPDLVLLDMNFRVGFNDGEEGIYWLQHIKDIRPDLPVILMTAYGEVELAVRAVKLGAFDFVLKPWTNEQLLQKVSLALKSTPSKFKNGGNKRSPSPPTFHFVEGNSQSMREVIKLIEKVSPTEANILILGESGTGKQALARKIHELSERKDKPFVHVDLGALSGNLFESELFGYKKGAFTDAKEDRKGRFELAEGGTIFLDEIGNLPLNLQVKLLAVLQERKVSRLGEGIERPLNVRFLCATNAELAFEAREGRFREDLMYRINTIEIKIPPLRNRQEDISIFIRHFIAIFSEKYKKEGLTISREALNLLNGHNWPGNIRELEHAVERAVILSDGKEIQPGDFRLNKGKEDPFDPDMDNLNLQDIEIMLIEKALAKHSGNISKAARDLGLTRAALYRRMEKYNL